MVIKNWVQIILIIKKWFRNIVTGISNRDFMINSKSTYKIENPRGFLLLVIYLTLLRYSYLWVFLCHILRIAYLFQIPTARQKGASKYCYLQFNHLSCQAKEGAMSSLTTLDLQTGSKIRIVESISGVHLQYTPASNAGEGQLCD